MVETTSYDILQFSDSYSISHDSWCYKFKKVDIWELKSWTADEW